MQNDILFVPGRLSLIGEVSDLITPYISLDKDDFSHGEALTVTLEQGIYSSAKKSNNFVFRHDDLYYECDLQEKELEKQIKSNKYFSYICGTLLYMKRIYGEKIGGLELEIVKMDLPMKKGFSSSAAICITVTKHINRLYNLNLTDNDIIDIAYEGERLTGSKCGRLDQSSIINIGLSHLIFLNDSTEIKTLNTKENIYILIVDLNAKRDTKKIIGFYDNAMASPQKLNNMKVYNFFKYENPKLVDCAISSLESGNVSEFGEILTKFQKCIDSFGDDCDELKAPVLHSVLDDKFISDNTYGRKGVGAGGDGGAMLVCKSVKSRKDIMMYLKEKYNMESIEVDIKKEGALSA